MKRNCRIASRSLFTSAALTLVFGGGTAAAIPRPDPEVVILQSQQVLFLQAEMKHVRNLKERALIHNELMLIYLDGLREPR